MAVGSIFDLEKKGKHIGEIKVGMVEGSWDGRY
jgi:hypothetical protein